MPSVDREHNVDTVFCQRTRCQLTAAHQAHPALRSLVRPQLAPLASRSSGLRPTPSLSEQAVKTVTSWIETPVEPVGIASALPPRCCGQVAATPTPRVDPLGPPQYESISSRLRRPYQLRQRLHRLGLTPSRDRSAAQSQLATDPPAAANSVPATRPRTGSPNRTPARAEGDVRLRLALWAPDPCDSYAADLVVRPLDDAANLANQAARIPAMSSPGGRTGSRWGVGEDLPELGAVEDPDEVV
ncbi:hypothetical protein PSU4_57160 [Pseudonocardia sulfidoxydans NBRC 16205]|uniref:Uncharacterized protein n=2 Tax=Pseudonocardia sulfidoxydans TaxID=54011 RepID=A0A511DPL6_9PSEU|nr:hypothetical protein PSU4_57160 [Pseudonocardia sulfidoxydans NBRC 16205]